MPIRVRVTDGAGANVVLILQQMQMDSQSVPGRGGCGTGKWMAATWGLIRCQDGMTNDWSGNTLFHSADFFDKSNGQQVLRLDGLMGSTCTQFSGNGTGELLAAAAGSMQVGAATWVNLDGNFAAPAGDGTDPKTGALTPDTSTPGAGSSSSDASTPDAGAPASDSSTTDAGTPSE